jgi:hypothetical protein
MSGAQGPPFPPLICPATEVMPFTVLPGRRETKKARMRQHRQHKQAGKTKAKDVLNPPTDSVVNAWTLRNTQIPSLTRCCTAARHIAPRRRLPRVPPGSGSTLQRGSSQHQARHCHPQEPRQVLGPTLQQEQRQATLTLQEVQRESVGQQGRKRHHTCRLPEPKKAKPQTQRSPLCTVVAGMYRGTRSPGGGAEVRWTHNVTHDAPKDNPRNGTRTLQP